MIGLVSDQRVALKINFGSNVGQLLRTPHGAFDSRNLNLTQWHLWRTRTQSRKELLSHRTRLPNHAADPRHGNFHREKMAVGIEGAV